MSNEQIFIYLVSILACAHFSFKYGFISGATEGVDVLLSHLEKSGYIKVDDDGNISGPSI